MAVGFVEALQPRREPLAAGGGASFPARAAFGPKQDY